LALNAVECQGYYGGWVSSRDLATAGVVAVGGAIGGLARYGVAELSPWRSPDLPWATLTVNLAGCLAIGVVLVVLTEGPVSPWWARPFVAIGLLGGFTTF